MRKHIKGIDASPGVAVGKVFLYKEEELFIDRGEFENTEIQKERLIEGREKTKQQLLKIREKTALKLGEDKAAIFDGHITLLEDEDLFEEVEELIEEEKISAENALEQGIRGYCDMLSNLEDEYLRERAADLKDIAKRWLYNIAGIDIVDLSSLPENSIVVARDLTPSDTAQLDRSKVVGFLTDIGGRTSHSAIMARSLEIPAVVSCKTITEDVNENDMIILDGEAGIVIVNPNEEEIKEYLNSDKELCADRSDYDYCLLMITSIVNKIGKYQDEVAKHLKKNWSVDRLSKIELAILIVACYELLETDQSREIIINEAVELSKKYCDNDSYKFINGLLNKVVK